MHKYLHNKESNIVYKVPLAPQAIELKDRRGRREGWILSMEIDITRADNILNGNQWKYSVRSCPRQHFDARYDKEIAISYFMLHHTPDGEEIDAEQYKVIAEEYKITALSRKG